MKKLQLYRMTSRDGNLNDNPQFTNFNEKSSLNISDYYSIYSQNVEVTYIDKENNSSTSEKVIYHPNSNVNEYHKLIKTKRFTSTVISDISNYKNSLNSNTTSNEENFITINLNTREKLISSFKN
jgi:hypothetical protein